MGLCVGAAERESSAMPHVKAESTCGFRLKRKKNSMTWREGGVGGCGGGALSGGAPGAVRIFANFRGVADSY